MISLKIKRNTSNNLTNNKRTEYNMLHYLYLTLCHPGGGGPKDPQLIKSPNAQKLAFKSSWDVFDFSYIDFIKISNQKF